MTGGGGKDTGVGGPGKDRYRAVEKVRSCGIARSIVPFPPMGDRMDSERIRWTFPP